MSRQSTMTPSLDARQFKVFKDSLIKLEQKYTQHAQNVRNEPKEYSYWMNRKQSILLVMHNLEEVQKI
mgnify:FL=1